MTSGRLHWLRLPSPKLATLSSACIVPSYLILRLSPFGRLPTYPTQTFHPPALLFPPVSLLFALTYRVGFLHQKVTTRGQKCRFSDPKISTRQLRISSAVRFCKPTSCFYIGLLRCIEQTNASPLPFVTLPSGETGCPKAKFKVSQRISGAPSRLATARPRLATYKISFLALAVKSRRYPQHLVPYCNPSKGKHLDKQTGISNCRNGNISASGFPLVKYLNITSSRHCTTCWQLPLLKTLCPPISQSCRHSATHFSKRECHTRCLHEAPKAPYCSSTASTCRTQAPKPKDPCKTAVCVVVMAAASAVLEEALVAVRTPDERTPSAPVIAPTAKAVPIAQTKNGPSIPSSGLSRLSRPTKICSVTDRGLC